MRYLGNLAVVREQSVRFECPQCQVAWDGCAAVCECPVCGDGKEYWQLPSLPRAEIRSQGWDGQPEATAQFLTRKGARK